MQRSCSSPGVKVGPGHRQRPTSCHERGVYGDGGHRASRLAGTARPEICRLDTGRGEPALTGDIPSSEDEPEGSNDAVMPTGHPALLHTSLSPSSLPASPYLASAAASAAAATAAATAALPRPATPFAALCILVASAQRWGTVQLASHPSAMTPTYSVHVLLLAISASAARILKSFII